MTTTNEPRLLSHNILPWAIPAGIGDLSKDEEEWTDQQGRRRKQYYHQEVALLHFTDWTVIELRVDDELTGAVFYRGAGDGQEVIWIWHPSEKRELGDEVMVSLQGYGGTAYLGDLNRIMTWWFEAGGRLTF